MKTVVLTSNPRADLKFVDRFAKLGVATTHEASGRAPNLMKTYIRPVWPGACIAGSVVTALAQPGDNWMIHVAAEQCRAGDVLVVACTTDNTDGMFACEANCPCTTARDAELPGGVFEVNLCALMRRALRATAAVR
jgi:4-hydroxy-4-methyl-2-oxoglutarate aldolase